MRSCCTQCTSVCRASQNRLVNSGSLPELVPLSLLTSLDAMRSAPQLTKASLVHEMPSGFRLFPAITFGLQCNAEEFGLYLYHQLYGSRHLTHLSFRSLPALIKWH